MVAVADVPWISWWRVLGAADFFVLFFRFFSFIAHGLLQVWGRLALFTVTNIDYSGWHVRTYSLRGIHAWSVHNTTETASPLLAALLL